MRRLRLRASATVTANSGPLRSRALPAGTRAKNRQCDVLDRALTFRVIITDRFRAGFAAMKSGTSGQAHGALSLLDR